jgi:hypothetical protein
MNQLIMQPEKGDFRVSKPICSKFFGLGGAQEEHLECSDAELSRASTLITLKTRRRS